MCAFSLDGIGNIIYADMPEGLAQTSKRVPQLPKGNSSIFRGVSENLSFHASPEAFIVARIHQLQREDPSALDSRTPIRAKILNRNVAIISSYEQIQSILKSNEEDEEQPLYVASSAYSRFMDQFFPPPNLLLSDGCPHMRMRRNWDHAMDTIRISSSNRLRALIASFWKTGVLLGTQLDLYELMKSLSWRILLDVFLKLTPYDESWLFDEVRSLQEDLLRGQFSLMPVSINARIWQSPRSKGIAAREKLQNLIIQRLHKLRNDVEPGANEPGVDQNKGDLPKNLPFPIFEQEVKMDEVRDHILMMTSSLAVKALASLLTAFLLNLCFFRRGDIRILDELKTMGQTGQAEARKSLLLSVYFETERLSPPIVGIMRRVSRDTVIAGWNSEEDTLLPAKWDTWLYFMGAGRDSAVFGKHCVEFNPIRYLSSTTAEPLGFSVGLKSCLGKDFIRAVVLLVAELFLESGLVVTGENMSAGVKAWLGWESATPEVWAADMKQLPTQRPAAPVNVVFARA